VAKELREMAAWIAVVHPKNPRRQQQAFLRAASQAGRRQGRPIWADPEKFKKLMLGMKGVVVEDKKES